MKKIVFTMFITAATAIAALAQDVKQITDCTITFQVTMQDAKADPQVVKSMEGAVKTLYLHGAKSRSDLETSGFKQTTLFDAKSDSTVVLREIGNIKYISYLNSGQRNEKNKKYDNIEFIGTSEKKTILGYDCKKVIAKLADGSTYNVYYTPSIIAGNNEYEYQFKKLAGTVLEYEAESEDGKSRIRYVATKISLTPVPNAKFDIPKSGYRVL